MQLSHLISLALATLAAASFRKRHATIPPYPTITGSPTGTGTVGTISPTGTGVYNNYTVTGTGTSTPPVPTAYDAFEVLYYPCLPYVPSDPDFPPYGTLTCCELKFDGSTSFSDCIDPFKIVDENYDACPIPQKSGQCCAQVNPDGTATGCKIASVRYDTTYPPTFNRKARH